VLVDLELEDNDLRRSIRMDPNDLPGGALKVHLFTLDQEPGEHMHSDPVKLVRTTGADQDFEFDHRAHGTAAKLTEVAIA
jgi:hypothetical protein